jgi:hypothetical protein
MSVVKFGSQYPSPRVTVTNVGGSVPRLPGPHPTASFDPREFDDPRYLEPPHHFTTPSQLLGQTYEVLQAVGTPDTMMWRLNGHLVLFFTGGEYYMSVPGLPGLQNVHIVYT